MLFNSYLFIFIFLPMTMLGFFLIGFRGYHRIANAWLVVMSLLFYAWWNPIYLSLMLVSILFNYGIGVVLSSERLQSFRRKVLFLGVAFNLMLLGYFKYANFFYR